MIIALARGALKLAGWLNGFAGKQIDATTQRQQIQANRDAALAATHASVIQTAMGHRMFWVAWSVAAIPTAAWYGWGMLDSLANGSLPDVASLPPQLKAYADTVWQNIFYTGAGVAGATGVATVIAKAIARR